MRFVIADDHRLMREMLSDTLARVERITTKIEIIEATNYVELHALAAQQPPFDLILLDYHMPGVDGIAGIARVISAFSGIPVIVISGTMDSALARQCIEAGAAGFIPKTVSSTAFRNAVRVVLDGEKFIHAYTLSYSSSASSDPGGKSNSGESSGARGGKLPQWSAREAQVLDLLIGGKTNKQIAREIDLQEMTVKTHVRNIYRKLGAVNRADAVRMVLQARGQAAGSERDRSEN